MVTLDGNPPSRQDRSLRCQPYPDRPHCARGKTPGRRPRVGWHAGPHGCVGPVGLGGRTSCVFTPMCFRGYGWHRLPGHVSVGMVRRQTIRPLYPALSQGVTHRHITGQLKEILKPCSTFVSCLQPVNTQRLVIKDGYSVTHYLYRLAYTLYKPSASLLVTFTLTIIHVNKV